MIYNNKNYIHMYVCIYIYEYIYIYIYYIVVYIIVEHIVCTYLQFTAFLEKGGTRFSRATSCGKENNRNSSISRPHDGEINDTT